jgi:hypothetical protein
MHVVDSRKEAAFANDFGFRAFHGFVLKRFPIWLTPPYVMVRLDRTIALNIVLMQMVRSSRTMT